jgi:predicted nicotinamide N-methyase
MTSNEDEDHRVTLKNGTAIQLHAEPQSFARDTTGWMTWNASISLIDYLQSPHCLGVKGQKVADLSTGNGLVALAAAYLGAKGVVATEIPSCSALTRVNVDCNPSVKNIIEVKDYLWGAEGNCPIQGCNLVLACDLLFIAVRDSIYDLLHKSLVDICQANERLLFAYEERIVNKEQAFMTNLAKELNVEAIADAHIEVTNDGDDMFYEPPSVRMYFLTKKK